MCVVSVKTGLRGGGQSGLISRICSSGNSVDFFVEGEVFVPRLLCNLEVNDSFKRNVDEGFSIDVCFVSF